MNYAQRLHAKELMELLYRYRGQFDYPPGDQRQSRDVTSWNLSETRMRQLLRDGGRPMMDCSEACSWILKTAGCWHWPEPGYTGSHLDTIKPHYLDPRAAGLAALVVFGPGTGHHEAMVYLPDRQHGNPLLWSHGHQGCDLVKLHDLQMSQTETGHPGATFLTVAKL